MSSANGKEWVTEMATVGRCHCGILVVSICVQKVSEKRET